MPALAAAETGSSLWPRIVSALVLAPVVVAIAWVGGVALQLLVVAAGGIMAWEWARLCHGGRLEKSGRLLIAFVVTGVALSAVAGVLAGLVWIGIGALLIFWIARPEPSADPPWLAAGALWIAVPCVALLWLTATDPSGRITILWLFAIVWATDIGAYAAGRQIGGPRLAPRLSPRKTWAGLVGGIVCAALAGWGTAEILGLPVVLPLVLVSAALAIVEQFGDLAESMAKRRFNVKDSSGLIPGHGGLLDRLDGLLAVIPAVALLSLFDDGRVLAWR